jgi:hypothetical protein
MWCVVQAAVEEEKRGRAQVAGELRATAATVERLQKQLADAHSACAAATAARDAVAEELRGATLRHQGDAAKAQAALTAAENKARDVLVSGQSAVRALEAQMEADAAAARAEQEERARAARTAHTAEIAALRATHDAELAALHATHERAVAALHASHDAVVQAAVEGVQGRLHAYERSASELGASLSVCHGELSDARAAAAAAHTAAEQQRAHLQQQLDAALRSAAAADQRAQYVSCVYVCVCVCVCGVLSPTPHPLLSSRPPSLPHATAPMSTCVVRRCGTRVCAQRDGRASRRCAGSREQCRAIE